MKQYPPIHIVEPAECAGNSRKKVVITGASGMVGSYLAAELLSRGFRDITIMLRSLGALQKIREVWRAECFPYDPSALNIAPLRLDDNEKNISEIFDGADIVFNCAASVNIGGADRKELIANNVTLARRVARAAFEARAGLLVHVSSVAALLPSPDGRIGSDSLTGCGEKASGYAESKYLSELEIEKISALGLKTVTVNPVTILGWGYGGAGKQRDYTRDSFRHPVLPERHYRLGGCP